MADDIAVNINFNLGKDQTVADIVTLLRKYQPYNKLHGQAADEIEWLRSICEEFARSGTEFGTKYGSHVAGFRINENKFRKAWQKYRAVRGG